MVVQQLTCRNRFLTRSLFVILFFLFSTAMVGAEEIDNETCLNCHDGLEMTLLQTPHSPAGTGNPVQCVDCHINADAHIEEPALDNITNPANLSVLAATNICAPCHQPHRDLDNYGYDAHKSADINCFSCHMIHGTNPNLLVDDRAAFCLSCHDDTQTDFMKRTNHPVKDGAMTCLSCHQFSTHVDDNLAYDMNRMCQDCHPNQAGPFMYEHAPVTGYSVEGGGCIECHDPHGSENDRLLKQPGNNLCNSCHMTPPVHLTAHPNFSYEYMNCVQCHTGVHGSYDSNLLLDPNLPSTLAENCYQSGCHSLNR